MTAPKKPTKKQPQAAAALDTNLSIPPDKTETSADGKTLARSGAKPADAAEALKRLSKMTPEEQAAALFQTMLGSSGKKSW